MSNEEYFEDDVLEEQADPMDSVFEKIEQANLYKALLNQELFEESAASAEVVEKVTQELRQFVSQRLQMLVGLSPSEPVAQLFPFSDQQIAALKVLADRILTPSRQPSRPEVPPARRNIVKVQKTVVQKPNIQKSVTSNKPHRRPARPATANVSEVTGQDYSQAVNPNGRPLPQPTQAEVDNRNAAQATANSSNIQTGDWSRILQTAAAIYQKQNANIPEE